MEAGVTTMASGSRSAFSFRKHCVTCGALGYCTPRMWDCEVCRDYLLCESCYKGSLEDCEALPAPPQVHNRDHRMSPHVTSFVCDGCDSFPIWNLRWRCKVCLDFDLCEACCRELGAADLPPEHSAEHPMVAVEVLCTEWQEFQSSFSKPVDPQWSYRCSIELSETGVSGDMWSGFEWVKKKPLAEILCTSQMGVVEDNAIIETSPKANEDNSYYISRLEEQISLDHIILSSKHASETTPAQQSFDKKHKIFLSHAGAEKDFVEQLYLDLSRVHHFGTFFDKDDGSLPKGEPFPGKILNAAKHCELAIVVISTDYFTRIWPMLELAAFAEAQKTRPELKILPVFYKLSVEEFKQPKRQQSYVKVWNQWLRSSAAEGDVQRWKEALKVISRTNGLEYDKRMGEVAFREKIVETVYKRVKPDLLWDDSHVQGRARMQEKIQEETRTSSNSSSGSLCMGLYGMGGSGKTTMCKVFRNEMLQQYLGQVCHIEFGSMDMVQLRKKLLQCISLLDSSLLLTIDEGQALKLLKHHMPKHKICLIIDNVSDDHASIEEARTLLNLPFKEGSLILVTSRSCMILEKLNVKWGALMRIPTLTRDEDHALFTHHAGCDTSNLTEDQKKAMENFVERCNFKVDSLASREYHPLALKVLGIRVGPNPEEWQNIRIDFKYYENENKHHIFSILRSSYDSLIPQHQRMFLDIALSSSNCFEGIHINNMKWHMRCLYGKDDQNFISELIKVLQAKSLVEFSDVQSGVIHIHDLYREFANMEVERNELHHSPSCCLSRGSTRQHSVQQGRLRIQNQLVHHITKDILLCKMCSRAELISIQGCPNLKSVVVPDMRNLKIFEVYGECPQLTRVNLAGAVNLQCLVWHGFVGEYPDLTSLESLEGLWLVDDEVKSPLPLQGCLDFSRSSNLEVLCLSYLPLNMRSLNHALTLKQVFVDDCRYLERLDGVDALVKLEFLDLRVCSSLLEFPSVANFPSLVVFVLTGAAKLKEIHGFANSTAIKVLSLSGARKLEELPGIEACGRLSHLYLAETNLENFSWISKMKDLTVINLSATRIRFVPDCSELTKLTRLYVKNCEALMTLGNTVGIHPTLPSTVQMISAKNSRSLKAVPQFNSESALYYLKFSGTCVEDVSGVMNCKHLRKLFCAETRMTSLPDLSSLTRLEVLDVHGCQLLTRMDNIKGLRALKKLFVYNCTRLLALPDLGSSKGLTDLSLRNCPLVNPNLVKLPSGSIVDAMDMAGNAGDEQVGNGEGHESENETVAVRGCDEPEPVHFLQHSLYWAVSWCGGLGVNSRASAD